MKHLKTGNKETKRMPLPFLPETGKQVSVIILILIALSCFVLFSLPIGAACAANSEWSRSLEGQTYVAPQLANGILYVGTNSGILYAFDELSGKLKWRFQTDYKVPCFPLVGQDGMIYLGSDNGALYVLNSFTGKLSWKTTSDILDKFALEHKLPYRPMLAPALGKKEVLLSTPNGNINAFDRVTGKKLWSFAIMGGYISSPSVYKNTAFIGCEDGRLIAIDLTSGERKWSYLTDGSVRHPPAIKNNQVYFGSTNKRLYVLDAKTGKLDWAYSAKNSIESTPIFYKNLVCFSTSRGNLCAVDTDKHQLVWEFNTAGSAVSEPVLDKDTIYLGCNDGRLYAISSSKGKLLWAHDTTGFLVSPVAVSERFVYMAVNRKEDKSLNIEILSFQKGTYPGTEVVVLRNEENFLLTSLVNYFSATAKNKPISGDRILNLSDSISWSFGYPLNQAKQALIDSVTSSKTRHNYHALVKGFNYFSPGFSASAFLLSFVLTPYALLLVLVFLLLGGVLLITFSSALGVSKMIFLLTGSAETDQKKLFLTTICFRSLGTTLKNYQLILVGIITTVFGAFISLAFFNYLSPIPTTLSFYYAILLTWIILLINSSIFRSFSLTFIEKTELNITKTKEVIKHTIGASSRLFAISLIYLTSGLSVCLLLALSASYNSYLFATLATFTLTITVILPMFADGYIVYEKAPLFSAIARSSYLALSNFKPVAAYLAFTLIVIGLCSLLFGQLIGSTIGAILSVLIAVFTSSWLIHIHAAVFQELNKAR